jgi:hypothetical protein
VSERLPAERERVLTVDKVGCYRRLHLWGDKWFDENGNAYV